MQLSSYNNKSLSNETTLSIITSWIIGEKNRFEATLGFSIKLRSKNWFHVSGTNTSNNQSTVRPAASRDYAVEAGGFSAMENLMDAIVYLTLNVIHQINIDIGQNVNLSRYNLRNSVNLKHS
uniref:Uncharacterized protein n=1 Tax=Romanomermis culicivorax TaxID=13658 RepID=A0A915L1U9_ROMCU